MKRRNLYPVFLGLHNRIVVVVGGGAVAERKVVGLLECGAEVRVVAPAVTDGLAEMARRRSIEWIRREFASDDVRDAHLAFAATDNPAVNTRVCQACDWQGVLVNRVEMPEASDFIIPSTLRRGGLTIAVSTSGASPHLARRIRQELEDRYDATYGPLVKLLEKARARVLQSETDPDRRSDILKQLAHDDALIDTLRQDGADAAWDHIQRILTGENPSAADSAGQDAPEAP